MNRRSEVIDIGQFIDALVNMAETEAGISDSIKKNGVFR